MVDFQFYLNRQGPRGPKGYKGDKGDDGQTPVPRTGTNTPIETTVIFDTGDGNPYETPNLKYPIQDRGGDVVMLDRTNSTQYYGTPNEATDDSYGMVKLATPESVLNDPLDNDVVTYKLFDANNQAIKTVTDGLAGDITQLNTDLGVEITNRTNADIQLTNKINTDVGNEATARSNADIALSGRIDNLTTSKADKSDVYTKTQTDSLLNNKSNVGHTHNYNDLTNKPTIGNGTITITQGGVTKGVFTTNQLSNQTIALESGGGGSDFTTGVGLELTQQDVLNVKIDGTTITTNASGELVSNSSGTNYTAGDAIDLTNDTISVKYNSDTLGVNASNELYAKTQDPLPSQSGNDGKFLTTDGSTLSWVDAPAPTNMVTTNTTQEISGAKTFVGTSGTYFRERSDRNHYLRIHYPGGSWSHIVEIMGKTDAEYDSKIIFENNSSGNGGRLKFQNSTADIVAADAYNNIYPLLAKKKTITQASANVSESSGTVTVTDSDVTTNTLVSLYPGDTATETWLSNNLTSNIITEGAGSFMFNISGTLPSTFSMYYIIQGVV